MKRFVRSLISVGLVLAGIASAAFGLKGFLLSSRFIDGGVTGISMLLSDLLHLPLLHGMAVLVAFIRHGRADWLYVSPFSGAQPPANAGFGLLGVYIFWISAIILLYPICKWFSELKLRRRDWWLSYL